MKIENPDQYTLSAIVEKDSNSGLLTHKRFLVLKTGMLFYYSNVPKQVKNDSKLLQGFKQFPKSSVSIGHLITIKSDPKKPLQLTLSFEAKNKYQKKQIIRKSGFSDDSPTQNKNNNELVQWKFTFSNIPNQKLWAKSLEQLRDYYKKQAINQSKFFQSFNNDKKRIQNNNTIKTSPRRASQKIEINKSANQNKFRQSQYFGKTNKQQKLNTIIEEDDQKQEQLQKELKVREQKIRMDLEQKIRKQYEEKYIEENKRLQQQRRIQKNLEQEQRLRLLEIRQKQLEQMETQLKKKLAQQQRRKKQIQQKQKELKRMETENILYEERIKKQQQQNSRKFKEIIKKTNQTKSKKIIEIPIQNQTLKNQPKNIAPKLQIFSKVKSSIQISKNQDSPSINTMKHQAEDQKPTVKIVNQWLKKQGEKSRKEKLRFELNDILSLKQQRVDMEVKHEIKQQKNKGQSIDIKKNEQILLNKKPEKNERMVEQTKIRNGQKNQKKSKQGVRNEGVSNQEISDQEGIKLEEIKSEGSKSEMSKSVVSKQQSLVRTDIVEWEQQLGKDIKQEMKQQFQDMLDLQEKNLAKINIQDFQMFKYNFQQKLNHQIRFIKSIHYIRNQILSTFQSIVSQIQSPNKKYPLLNHTYTNQYYQIQIAFSHTNIINIQNKHKYIYDQSPFKKYRRKVQIYQQMQSRIINILKKKPFYGFRVPVTFYLQYKGVCGLGTYRDIFEQQNIEIESDSSLYGQIKLIMNQQQMKYFNIGKLLNRSDIYIIYLKQVYRRKKQNNIEFKQFPINPEFLNNKKRVCFSWSNLERIKNSIQKIEQNMEAIQAIEMVQSCKNIRKVYRAGQGQLNDKVFWELVFKKDKKLINMFQDNNNKELDLKNLNKGIMLEYLNKLIGGRINIKNSKKQINVDNIKDVKMQVIIKGYDYDNLEIKQIIHHFDKYIKQNKISLARKSLHLLKNITNLHSQQAIIQYIFAKIKLSFFQKQYQGTINLATKLKNALHYTSYHKLHLYFILFNSYKMLNQYHQFILTFNQCVQYFHCVFGQNPYLITLYSTLAQYISTFCNIDQALQIYQFTLELSNKIYKNNQKLRTEIYIDMSNIYINGQDCKLSMESVDFMAGLLKEVQSDSQLEARLNSHISTLYYLVGKIEQGEKYLKKGIQYYKKNQVKYSQQLHKSYFLLIKNFDLKNNIDYIQKYSHIYRNNKPRLKQIISIIIQKLLKSIHPQTIQKAIHKLSNKNIHTQNLSSKISQLHSFYNLIEYTLNQALVSGNLSQNNEIIKIINAQQLIDILRSGINN